MMFTFVVYNSIYIPIDIALFNIGKALGQCVCDVLIDTLFIVDMLLNLRTTYYDGEGQLVLERDTIFKRYLCSYWFVIDFLAVFPFDMIANRGWDCGSDSQSDDADASMIKLLKALRLLRLLRFRKELDRLSGANALQVGVSLFVFVLVAHWLACFWWAIGYFEYEADENRALLANTSVTCDHTHECSWLRRIPGGGEPLTPDSPFEQQYFTAFFWSLTTLMKTPWVAPDTISEKVFGIIAIFSGAIFYAYFLTTVQGSYASYSKAGTAKRDKLGNLTAFMNKYDIKGEVRQRLIKHTNAQAAMLPLGLVNSTVLMQLPSHLRGNIALEIYAEACGSPSAMFPGVSIEAAKALVVRLHTQLIMPEQVLISKGEVCAHLYFLVKGGLRATADAPAHASSPPSPLEPPRSCAVEDTSGTQRRSSRKSRASFACMREIERPGSSVGLCEPMDAKSLGLFPAWVIATKKSLLLTIKQRDIIDALEGFRPDVEPLRDTLSKQHKALMDSLKIESTQDSPLAVSEAAVLHMKERASEREGMHVTGDDQARVAALEDIVQDTITKVAEVSKHMECFPEIMSLIDVANSKGMLATLVGKPN